MTKERWREYNRRMQKIYRKKKAQERPVKNGYCPHCTAIIESEYHQKFPCKGYIHDNLDFKTQ